jgi:hypothetical protein
MEGSYTAAEGHGLKAVVVEFWLQVNGPTM